MCKCGLVSFEGSGFYAYKVIDNDLEKGELVIVETGDSYSLGIFQGYTYRKDLEEKATKYIVKSIKKDIEAFKVIKEFL